MISAPFRPGLWSMPLFVTFSFDHSLPTALHLFPSLSSRSPVCVFVCEPSCFQWLTFSWAALSMLPPLPQDVAAREVPLFTSLQLCTYEVKVAGSSNCVCNNPIGKNAIKAICFTFQTPFALRPNVSLSFMYIFVDIANFLFPWPVGGVFPTT